MNDQQGVSEKIIYFDCYSGISGDMVLGALLDLGLDLEELRAMLAKLPLSGYRLDREAVRRGAIAGTRALVELDQSTPVDRHLSSILSLIESGGLPRPVAEKSSAIFRALAEAEAAVHGMSVEKVHFHEVGAVDAIIDIVGAAAGLYLLGIDRVVCSPLPAGRGEIKTAHGKLPLPAPATLELIARRQAPVRGVDLDFELVTPTGAAIVTTLADYFGPLPEFTVEAVGYGAASIDPGYPNYLRAILGSSPLGLTGYSEDAVLIETNIDDLNPEILGYVLERLFAAGALDAFYTPIQMKKNRPAVKLTVLVQPDQVGKIEKLLFYETSTLGLRQMKVHKVMRPRESVAVQTEWGEIRVKFCPTGSEAGAFDYAPEYEDCARVARISGLPLKEVYRLAEALYRQDRGSGAN